MPETPTPPELLEAYRLIKAGQRQEAGKLLKSYLAQNGRDAKAWWLMAHAVDKPENVQRCLETVLKLDPNNTKAREKLARLTTPTPGVQTAPAAPKTPAIPAAAAAPQGDEPDDAFFGVSSAPPKRTSKPAVPPKAPEVKPAASQPPTVPAASPAVPPTPSPVSSSAAASPVKPPSFEEYAANTAVYQDPFATPVMADGDPFADLPHPGSPGLPGVGLEAGPLKPPKPSGLGSDFAAGETKHAAERMIGFGLVGFAFLVAIGLILYLADRQGLINISNKEKVPTMTMMDQGSFQIDYPQGWDARCLSDASGYPVCGVANHPLYNEVSYYAGQVDLGKMISDSMGSLLGGSKMPEKQVSIIVMDVPRTSPSYDDSSLAKTKYEWDREYSSYLGTTSENSYDRTEITVDGRKAYYYKYTSLGRYNEAAWDVYMEHDGIILWFRVSYFGPRGSTIPDGTVQKMIQSIKIKPVAEWKK